MFLIEESLAGLSDPNPDSANWHWIANWIHFNYFDQKPLWSIPSSSNSSAPHPPSSASSTVSARSALSKLAISPPWLPAVDTALAVAGGFRGRRGRRVSTERGLRGTRRGCG